MQSSLKPVLGPNAGVNARLDVHEGDGASCLLEAEGGHYGTGVEGESRWAIWPSNRSEIRTTMYG